MNITKNYPWEIKDVDYDVVKKKMEQYTGGHDGFIRIGPKGYFFPSKFKQEAANIYNMEMRNSDVFVVSFPRSGTTWTQELVWMIANDLDYATSDAVPLTQRYPFLEFSLTVHPKMMKKFYDENKDNEQNLKLLEFMTGSGVEQVEKITAQRFIKTHLPLSLLSPKLLDTAKVVYVARDPRDVVVSFYHLNRAIRTQGYVGDFKTYWNYFRQNLHQWTPYFEHLKEAWEKRHHPNMLFLFYEELSKNLPAAVRRVASFFDKEFSEEQISRLCEHLSIENFKNNKSVNFNAMKILGIMMTKEQEFIRKGKSGGWRDYFDDEMTAEADKWIADNLKDTDFRYSHF